MAQMGDSRPRNARRPMALACPRCPRFSLTLPLYVLLRWHFSISLLSPSPLSDDLKKCGHGGQEKVNASMGDSGRESAAGAFSSVQASLDNGGQLGQPHVKNPRTTTGGAHVMWQTCRPGSPTPRHNLQLRARPSRSVRLSMPGRHDSLFASRIRCLRTETRRVMTLPAEVIRKTQFPVILLRQNLRKAVEPRVTPPRRHPHIWTW
jgi:hypothetical protein